MTTSPKHSRRRRGLAGAFAALALVATLTACGDDKSDTATTPSGSTASLTPPVIVDVTGVDGTTVDVPVGGTIDIKVPKGTEADWTPDITDTTIAHFVDGRTDGSATFNPGLVGDKVGSTTVTLSGTSGATPVEFTVQVTEA